MALIMKSGAPFHIRQARFDTLEAVSNTAAYHKGATNPGATDDSTEGFRTASIWINTSDNSVFICIGHLPGAAVWVKIGPIV